MRAFASPLVLLVAAVTVGCADDGAPPTLDTDGGGSSTGTTATTSASTTAAASDTDPEATITAIPNVTLYPEQPMVVDVEVVLSQPADLEVSHTFDDGVRIEEREGDETTRHYRVRGLAPATVHGLDWQATAEGATGSGMVEFTTEAPLRGFRGSFPVTGERDPSDPALTLIDLTVFPTADDTSLFFVDAAGVARWHFGAAGAQPLRPESIAGAAKLLPDGTVAYVHGLDFFVRGELNEEVTHFTYADLETEGMHHEVLLLPSGNFMALSFTYRTQNIPMRGQTYIVGDEIVEFTPEGEVVWRWNSFDHLDPTRIREGFDPPSTPHPDTGELAHDWTHGNGIEYDPETDTMLVSLRHQDWVINIDHATGDVLWRLGEEGDFTLESGTWFYHQHSPQWQPDGSILLYDNAFGNPAIPLEEIESRAVRYEIDTDAMTATQVWEDDAEPFGAVFAGDSDRLPSGRYLVLDTSIQDPPGMGPLHSRLRELDPDASPQTQWTLETGDGFFIYRATAWDRLPGEPMP